MVLVDHDAAIALPISIGPREGAAIAAAQAGIVPERPQTHDLMLTLMETGELVLREVRVTRLENGTFYAVLVLRDGRQIDCRPSDAIALAIRAGVPVRCAETVLAAAGVPVEENDEAEVVEEFRSFLEDVEPEDFSP